MHSDLTFSINKPSDGFLPENRLLIFEAENR